MLWPPGASTGLRVVLVSPPTLVEHGDAGVFFRLPAIDLETPPLGVLTVASLLRSYGVVDIHVIDSNRMLAEHLSRRDAELLDGGGSKVPEQGGNGGAVGAGFQAALAARIAKLAPDWVGFSTLCSCYHVTLAIAGEVKRRCPGALVVLGGPQASAVAGETLRECEVVDYVLCGEVEQSLGAFLEHVSSAPEKVPGLVWRTGDGVCSNPASAPADMEATPEPAFDLWGEGPIAGMPLEVGRGCPFSCRFCSTSVYFGRRYRVKPPQRVVAEAVGLHRRFRCGTIELIHDHLGANRQAFLDLCAAWRGEPELQGVSWTCSMRADAIDGEVVEVLRNSGCTAVFVGIETGSERMQAVVGKRLRLERAKEALGLLSAAGLKSKVAFIAGFPEESPEDFADTLRFFEWTMFVPGARPQMATLAPLAGSAYGEEWKEKLAFTGRPSDMAMQNSRYDGATLEFLHRHPALCSTHFSIPSAGGLDSDRLYATVRFLKYANGLLGLPLRAGVRAAGSLERLLGLWLDERLGPRLFESDYYLGGDFRRDLVVFLRSLPERAPYPAECAERFECLLDMHTLEDRHLDELRRRSEQCIAVVNEGIGEDPLLTAMCALAEHPYPFEWLAAAVMEGKPLSSVPRRRSVVSRMLTDDGVTAAAMSPLSAAVLLTFAAPLELSRGLERLVAEFSELVPDGISPDSVFAYAVQTLLDEGRLGFAIPE